MLVKRLMGWSPEVHAAELAERREDRVSPDEYEVLNLIADTAAALLAEPWRHRQAEQELYLAGYLARLEKIRSEVRGDTT